MKKIHLGMLVAAVTLVSAPAALASTPAEPTLCEGTLSNQIVGDVTVQYGATCTLSHVIVLGDVTGESYSGPITLDRTTVRGDLVATISESLELRNSVIGGSLDSSEAFNGVKIAGSGVVGDAAVRYASGPVTLGASNAFGGAVTVEGNYAGGSITRGVFVDGLSVVGNQGAFDVARNVVRGALDCRDNAPAPTGARNAAGQKLGQCAAL